MLTTVTLDADVDLLLKNDVRKRGVTFKVALNDAVRRAFAIKSIPAKKRKGLID